ncbi:hypothetical protein LTR84_010512 [Exophiala bonariae]|uniref:DUF7923 domain-containing protein n=1 Tax=Exophiala bonariae TaxID=1690606 RepID=A0AAV9MT22_9EURO|nr:hypothetical protein LTR84_010512 [Exophiala bonariae]
MVSLFRIPFLSTKSNVSEPPADMVPKDLDVSVANPANFESIADKVETLQAELAYAHDLCEQANLQFDMFRTEIYNFKQQNALLMQQLAERTTLANALQAQVTQQRADLRKERTLNIQMAARLRTETNSLKAMTNQAQTAQQHLDDAKFDIEYLKCTTTMGNPLLPPLTPDHETPLPPRPFVVVLVDGDAYAWSSDLFVNGGHSEKTPGGMAAMQIKFEVTKYIRDQKGTIPYTSAIVTRVFQNFQTISRTAQAPSRHGNGRRDWHIFSIQFTEKFPLFDFFDAGRGKERVDDKIREHFHLFLSHPNCYAIFLAACKDNGFARMLEPYVDHPSIREKIILVSPGFKAPEIAGLPFTTIVWPSIFKTEVAPRDISIKTAKHAREKQIAQWLSRLSLDKGTSAKTRAINFTPKPAAVLDLLQPWDVHCALARYFGMGTTRFNDFKRGEHACSIEPCADSLETREIE